MRADSRTAGSLERLAMPREQEPSVERTSDAARSGVGGFCEMPTCTADTLTVEQVLKWYDDSEATRNRDWRRFMALRDAAEQAMKFGELSALGDVLHALDDPRWIPSAGAEPEADVIGRESESGAGSQNDEALRPLGRSV